MNKLQANRELPFSTGTCNSDIQQEEFGSYLVFRADLMQRILSQGRNLARFWYNPGALQNCGTEVEQKRVVMSSCH